MDTFSLTTIFLNILINNNLYSITLIKYCYSNPIIDIDKNEILISDPFELYYSDMCFWIILFASMYFHLSTLVRISLDQLDTTFSVPMDVSFVNTPYFMYCKNRGI